MTPTPTLGRNDRYVRLARMLVSEGAPRHTLAFMIEEALRLCSLPGESEGRAYFFRHIHITGLPENGDRSVWLYAIQHALREQARYAVHGHDDLARTATAVLPEPTGGS